MMAAAAFIALLMATVKAFTVMVTTFVAFAVVMPAVHEYLLSPQPY